MMSGGQVPSGRRVLALSDKPPLDVGPITEPAVTTGPFVRVAHVMDGQRVVNPGLVEQLVEGDEEPAGVVVLIEPQGVENGSQAVHDQIPRLVVA